jgi:hypothetical protein
MAQVIGALGPVGINSIGAYDATADGGGGGDTFMDGVMTEEEWYSWRRRKRRAEHLFEWRNKKGPIY